MSTAPHAPRVTLVETYWLRAPVEFGLFGATVDLHNGDITHTETGGVEGIRTHRVTASGSEDLHTALAEHFTQEPLS